MDIKVFVWEGYLEDKFSMKILELIKSASLHYTLLPLKKDAEMDVISTMVGSKVRKPVSYTHLTLPTILRV